MRDVAAARHVTFRTPAEVFSGVGRSGQRCLEEVDLEIVEGVVDLSVGGDPLHHGERAGDPQRDGDLVD